MVRRQPYPRRYLVGLVGFSVLWFGTVVSVIVAALATAAEGEETPRRHAPKPQRKQPATVTVGWVGDTVLGSRYGVPAGEGRPVLARVRRLLRAPDVMIGNLEGTFSVGGAAKCGRPSKTCFAFQAPPSHARTLAWAGFDVMNLANNHANDYGQSGLQQTVEALDDAGVGYTGRPGEIHVTRRRGIRIAVLGFAASYPWAGKMTDLVAAQALVRAAGRRADIVIVAMHAGAEGPDMLHTPVGVETAYGESRGDTRGFAHAVVDAGADLVVGSGPHVLRGVERYRGRLIAYSLGNFAGYKTFGTTGAMRNSGVLQVALRRDGRLTRGRLTSLLLDPSGVPSIDRTHAGARLMRRLSREDFGAAGISASGRLAAGKAR